MFNRRQFLKSLSLFATMGVTTIPVTVKATPEPDGFVFDDIGPRGIGQMTEREQKAVQVEVQNRLNKEVRWDIPGRRDNIDRFVVLGNYLVTYKFGHRRNRVYIEAERTFHGDPPLFLTKHIDAVWKQYMDRRTGRIA